MVLASKPGAKYLVLCEHSHLSKATILQVQLLMQKTGVEMTLPSTNSKVRNMEICPKLMQSIRQSLWCLGKLKLASRTTFVSRSMEKLLLTTPWAFSHFASVLFDTHTASNTPRRAYHTFATAHSTRAKPYGQPIELRILWWAYFPLGSSLRSKVLNQNSSSCLALNQIINEWLFPFRTRCSQVHSSSRDSKQASGFISYLSGQEQQLSFIRLSPQRPTSLTQISLVSGKVSMSA